MLCGPTAVIGSDPNGLVVAAFYKNMYRKMRNFHCSKYSLISRRKVKHKIYSLFDSSFF